MHKMRRLRAGTIGIRKIYISSYFQLSFAMPNENYRISLEERETISFQDSILHILSLLSLPFLPRSRRKTDRSIFNYKKKEKKEIKEKIHFDFLILQRITPSFHRISRFLDKDALKNENSLSNRPLPPSPLSWTKVTECLPRNCQRAARVRKPLCSHVITRSRFRPPIPPG